MKVILSQIPGTGGTNDFQVKHLRQVLTGVFILMGSKIAMIISMQQKRRL
jgi:hypothetical protein